MMDISQLFLLKSLFREVLRILLLEHALPGPQHRGTGGTFIVVWRVHRDWGHSPVIAMAPAD